MAYTSPKIENLLRFGIETSSLTTYLDYAKLSLKNTQGKCDLV